jgi:hypothetical protein
VCSSTRPHVTQYSAEQKGRITRHIFPYLVPCDAIRCAALRVIRLVTFVLMKPYSAVRKFFLDIETLLSGKLIAYPIISSRTRDSVLSSATEPGPRSDPWSASKHTPIMSSTYMTVLLRRACLISQVKARVTT